MTTLSATDDSTAASSPEAQAARIPALDGVRGLAILLVLVYHQTILEPRNWLDAAVAHIGGIGWCGVDLFFVLSGFLITLILLDARGQPHYFRNFYARRVLRIFPLYYAVVFFSLVVLPHVHHPKAEHFGRVRGDEIWYWTYLSNFLIARHATFRHGILDVSWSLAIEEQFYVLWPAVVLWCGRRTLIGLCAALVALSLVFRTVLSIKNVDPVTVYVLTPSHVDALAVGCLFAAVSRGSRGLSGIIGLARVGALIAGALLIALLISGHDTGASKLMMSAGLTVFVLLFGSVLILAADPRPGRIAPRLFALPALRTFGKYSYALYLFNFPLRGLVRDWFFTPASVPSVLGSHLPGQLLFYAVVTGLSLALAYASWHLFEKHFLALKRYFPEPRGPAAGILSGTPGPATRLQPP